MFFSFKYIVYNFIKTRNYLDSTVASILTQHAIKDRLYCIFVDTGLLRLNEADNVEKTFKKHNININIDVFFSWFMNFEHKLISKRKD